MFEQLSQVLEERIEALLIGGAVMLELGLKDATKDIDVVCRSEEDKELLLAAAKALGFEIVSPDYNAVYREIEAQYRKAGGAKEKIWINYIEEGIARLQDNDLTIPISDKISLLASEYHEKGQMR